MSAIIISVMALIFSQRGGAVGNNVCGLWDRNPSLVFSSINTTNFNKENGLWLGFFYDCRHHGPLA